MAKSILLKKHTKELEQNSVLGNQGGSDTEH